MFLTHTWGALKVAALTIFLVLLAFPELVAAQGADGDTSIGIIQRILDLIPDWWQVLAAFGYAFSLLAAATPTVRDDEWSSGFQKFLAKVRKIIDLLGLSVGNANKQSKR